MPDEINNLNLRFDEYQDKGLYIILPDSSKLILTKNNIENTVEKFWSDPEKISPQVKMAVDFQRCYFCPLLGQKDMCDAIRPIMPFLEIVDKFVSFNKVIALNKGEYEVLQILPTTMQNALRYVSVLSLINFCQKGRAYWKYFLGVNPLMSGKKIAARFYQNVTFICNNDREQINRTLSKFNQEINITSKNQMQRLSLVCKNDVFLNALVNTQIISEILMMDMEKTFLAEFEEFQKRGPVL